MPENFNEIFNTVLIVVGVSVSLFVLANVFYVPIRNKFAPVKTEKAQVIDKFVTEGFSKTGDFAGRTKQYYVVFAIGKKKRSFG